MEGGWVGTEKTGGRKETRPLGRNSRFGDGSPTAHKCWGSPEQSERERDWGREGLVAIFRESILIGRAAEEGHWWRELRCAALDLAFPKSLTDLAQKFQFLGAVKFPYM